MKNQIQTAIDLRDRAVQVALNFVGQRISSSDGSYDLLIDCIHRELNTAIEEDRKKQEAFAVLVAAELRETLDGLVKEAKAEQAAVTAKAERDECLKILQNAYQEWFDGDHSPSEAFESAKEKIQFRGLAQPALAEGLKEYNKVTPSVSGNEGYKVRVEPIAQGDHDRDCGCSECDPQL